METTVNGSGDTTTATNGQAPAEAAPAETPQPEVVSKDVYERMKTDMLKAKQKADEVQKLLEQQKLQALKATQNWEEVAKVKEQEAEDFRKKYDGLSKAVVESKKYEVLKTEAMKSGINSISLADLELLDFPELEIETTSQGKIIVHGADRAISNLKTLRPHWFSAKPASVNPTSPETKHAVSGVMTVNQLNELEKAWHKDRTPQSKKAYEDALRGFNVQQQKRS